MNTIIKGGIVVAAEGSRPCDLLIKEGKIAAMGAIAAREFDTAEVVDASQKLIFPGFIDTHTHFDLDAGEFHTADNFYTGTRAALAGGTTTILDFATQDKGTSLHSTLARWHALARDQASCDYGFHMSISDWSPQVKKEIAQMKAEGITSFKLYMAYDNLRISDAEIFEILKEVKSYDGIIGVHCENGDLIQAMTRELKAAGELSVAAHPRSRPDRIEAEAIDRLLTIARLADAPVNIVHLSSQRGYEVVRRARAEGQSVFVESCPQYFCLDDSCYEQPGFAGAKFVLSPPLRKKEDCDCLWEALRQDQIDTIGTDHCSFQFHTQKIRGKDDFTKIPNGIPGVEHRPALMYSEGVVSGRITKEQLCAVLSTKPAKLFGLYPQKGVVSIGSDADLVLFDPHKKWVIRAENQFQNVDYTPYEGKAVTGAASTVFLRGIKVFDQNEILEEKKGIYLKRNKVAL